ncbi:HYR-like domain-containing protein, partial [Halocola ammonii]
MRYSTTSFGASDNCCTTPVRKFSRGNLAVMLVSFLFVLLSTNELSAQAAFLRSQQNLWGFSSGASSNAMDAVFGSGNWDDLRFETVNAGDLFANHDFIYMEGGDAGANEMEAFIQANQAAMESWVSSGGHLLINAAPNEGDGMDFGFGISLNYPSFVDMGEAVDTNHPAYDGVASVIDGSWFGHAIICPAGMTGITKDSADDTKIVFAEMPYGNGLVVAGGATIPYFGSWTPQPDAVNFVNNLVGYAAEGANTCSIALTCPEDAVVECGDDISVESLGDVSFESSCDGEAVVEVSEVYTEGCPAILERTFTVSVGDLSESCTQTIEIFDLDAPELDEFVAELTVSCLEEVPAPEQLSATDACSEESVEVEAFESNTGELISTCDLSTAFGPGADWSVWLDDFSYASSDHFVWDANGGTFDQFADGTAHLYGTVVNDMNPSESFYVDFWFQNASDWDTWSGMGRLYKDDLGIAGTNYEDWTYYEMADGFSTLTGLGDFAGDVLNFYHMPSDYTFGFQIGEAANNKNTNYGLSGWFTYTGTVDGQYVEGHGDVNVDAECEEQQESDCPNNTEFTYLYRASDDCGNQVVETQTITVNDETAPVFTVVPEDFTVECDELPVELFEGVEAEDNCVGDVSIEYVGEEQNGEGCEYTLTRTWIAEDICGNTAIHEQVITVVDTTAPEFTFVPEDITYECDEDVAVVLAEAEDNCQDVEVTYEDAVSGDSCETIIERTFYANDGCENVATATQIITVVDTTAPVFDPFDVQLFVECDETDQIFVSAQDNCQDVDITYEDQLQSGGCLGVLVRTYTADDGCGNTSTATQYITITDTTAPEIVGVPESGTVECDEIPTPEVTATDACGYDVELEFTEEIIEGDCPQNYTIVWNWVATDYCENVSEASATIVVEDTTSPVFTSFPENEVVECSDELPEVVYPTAEDNCGEVNIEMTEEIVDGECESEYTLNRIFRGFDECGNEVIATQTIEVVDTTAPVFEVELSNETFECSDDIPVVLPAASDNCSDVEVSYSDSEEVMNEECPQAYSFVRTYTAVDACGNESSISHTIFVEDTTAPVFGEYEIEIDMACDNIVATEIPVSDNCGEVSVSYNDEPVSGGCTGRIIRTFVAVDECGNEASAEQIITLVDETAPEFFDMPEDFTIECVDFEGLEDILVYLDEIDTSFPYALDNCTDSANVEFTYEPFLVTEGLECPVVAECGKTFTATDNCGNTVVHTFTVTIVDNTAPEFTFVPEAASYSCDEEVVYEDAEAVDVCSGATVSVEADTLAGDCPGNYTIVRTFTAVDGCGNESSASQEISIYDETAPEFDFVPENVTVECDAELPSDMATATDNCGSVSVSFEDSVDESTCETVIVRTFTAVDDCGNEATAQQIITVVDTTAPVIEGEIEVDMACDNIDDSIMIEATDNCNDVTITYTETGVSGGCAGRIIRDYVATDACGNSSEFQQIITLIDEVAPVFTSFPEDLTVECSEVPSVDGVQIGFDDNCTDVTLSYDGETIIEGDCAGEYTIERTWTITDACANATSQTQTINVIDTTAPELFVPADAAYSCDEDINYAGAEYSDNCSDVTLEVAVDTIAGDCAQNFTIVRTFTATDACGNSTVDS